MNKINSSSPEVIYPLTSLRFVFAVMVFLSHLSPVKNSNSPMARKLYDQVFQEGYVGVGFFFVLSGFVLALNYQKRILEKRISKRSFYVARVARIYPLHILTLLASIPASLYILKNHTFLGLSQLGVNLTLTQSYFPVSKSYFSFNAVAWSISTEMFFYIIFPFIIYKALPALKKYWWIMLLIGICYTHLVIQVLPEQLHKGLLYISPFFKTIDFCVGILLFNLYARLRSHPSLSRNNFSFYEVLSILIFCLFFTFHDYVPQAVRWSYYYWLPISGIVLAFSFQSGFISRFFSTKVLIKLGEISFGFYMIHKIIMDYTLKVTDWNTVYAGEFIFAIVVFVITLILSYYTHKLYEIPMNKLIKSKYQQYRESRLRKFAR